MEVKIKDKQNYKKIKNKRIYLFFKRVTDIIIGLIGAILLIPTSIILKIAMIITKDNGPLFFKQKRVGKNGKIITIYKYRSMVVGAEELLKKLMKKDPKIKEEYQKNKKLANDPRITKIGKFIRNTCIDEMPQFLNVLKGDMALIGPRPYLLDELKDIDENFDEIVAVRPGLTGWWQVSGHSDMSFKKRCKMDVYYANNYSIGLDLKIIFKTFSTILLNKGTK